MIESLYAAIFGAVQGLTEFLPVSSSGHLVLLHSIADFQAGDALAFDVALHVGTLVAVVVFFRNDIVRLMKGWLASLRGERNAEGNLAWWLLLATIPAALLGYFFESWFETAVRAPVTVGIVLILGGIGLWAADAWGRRVGELSSVTGKQALVIGIGQAFALIPGVSRSGATIMVARLLGFTRTAAARFSFLLSIPIIAGAGIKQGIELRGTEIDGLVFTVGMISAALVGWWAIGWLLKLVERHSYVGFAIYRLALGFAVIAYFGFLQ